MYNIIVLLPILITLSLQQYYTCIKIFLFGNLFFCNDIEHLRLQIAKNITTTQFNVPKNVQNKIINVLSNL